MPRFILPLLLVDTRPVKAITSSSPWLATWKGLPRYRSSDWYRYGCRQWECIGRLDGLLADTEYEWYAVSMMAAPLLPVNLELYHRWWCCEPAAGGFRHSWRNNP